MGIEPTSEAWEDTHEIQAWSPHSNEVMLPPGLAQSGKGDQTGGFGALQPSAINCSFL
jgi:hypothetical protein